MKHQFITLTALMLALVSTTPYAGDAPQGNTSSPATPSSAQAVALPSPDALRDDICWVAPEWLDD